MYCFPGGGGGGGALPLWESVGMRRGFAPHFRHLDDLFAPQYLTMSTILFRSCWVPFRSPTFSACRRSFCPPNWPNLSFYSDLVGSRFELRAAHPYWFWPWVPTPTPPGIVSTPIFTLVAFRFDERWWASLSETSPSTHPHPHPTPGARSSTAVCWIVWVKCKKGMALT